MSHEVGKVGAAFGPRDHPDPGFDLHLRRADGVIARPLGSDRRGVSDIQIYSSSVSKILVSVDDKLLAKIDRAAKSAGLTRSAYLSRLAARDLGKERGPGAGQQARRAVTRLQKLFDTHPSGDDATVAIRADRDAH